VDPISLVIKTAAAPVRCNNIAPPRWKLGGKWYCSFPALRDCVEPSQLPVDPVKISDVDILGLGLGKSIYSKEQMEDFSASRTARTPGGHNWRRRPSWRTWGEAEESGDSVSRTSPRTRL
jgi:hypothetical protein